MGYIIGADVSFYQDKPETPQGIDYVRMRQSASFVIIRAGQNLWPDPIFKATWADAKASGIPRGSYWFFDSRADPKRQAEKYVELLGGDLGELPLFADFEEKYNGPFQGWKQWCVFIERLKALVGKKEIGLYTAFYYWRDNAPNAIFQPTNLEYFHQYPLWIAHYETATPSIPKPWGPNEWLFWQYTDNGDGPLYGAESKNIDLNYFNGDSQTFIKRFNLSTTLPPPPSTIDQTGYKFQVNTTALNMRDGPGMTYNKVGVLAQGDVVDGIVALADKSWIQIRRSDGLTGWCSGSYLVVVYTPPPITIDQTGIQYQVNAAGLNVREGPGVTYNKVGVLAQGDVVDAIVALADKSWIQIRRSDGLTGWCSGAYLVLYVPPPSPIDQTWYRVNTAVLNARSGPAVNNPVVGNLQKDDVVASPGASSDGSWVQITRVDGLTGWCASSYLVNLGKTTPGSLNQKIFNGVTYFRKESSTPHKMIVHALGIDMQASGLQFLVTPPVRQSGPPLCSRKTSEFLSQYSLQIAVNADAFSYADPASFDPKVYCPTGGDPVWPNGYAVSRGNVYFSKQQVEPILIINQINIIQFYQPQGTVKPDGQVFNAVSGDRMLVINGNPVSGLDNTRVDPRTAVGLSKDNRWLILVVVDGRETSIGATLVELANLLVSFGVYTGMSLDGGGSSTMVIQGVDKKPRILNTPVDNNTFGQERAVANHLGIFVNK